MKKPLNKNRRRSSIIAFEMIRLDRSSREPLHQQLYRQIRDELAAGSFNQNSSRLPSTRTLAADLGIARLTVKGAFEKLHAEGYLRTKSGSGTFVADSLPETFLSSAKSSAGPQKERPARLSKRVKDIPDQRVGKQFDLGIAGAPGVSFVPALAALDEFPIDIWERLRAEVLAKKGSHLLQYASSRGDPELRRAIAAGSFVCSRSGSARRIPNRYMGTTQSRSPGEKRISLAPVCLEPGRSGAAQGNRSLLVRLPGCALSSRPNHCHRWDAAGDDDQRHGPGKSWRSRLARRPGILPGPTSFWFCGSKRGSEAG